VNHRLSCRCTRVRGLVSRTEERLNRSTCYCRDCQAYAHFLGQQGEMLDANGGTSVVGIKPCNVTLTQGQELVACMSFSERGLLRWYARCCNTAIGNTPRNFKVPFLAVVETCLEGTPGARERSFGPAQFRLNPKSARGQLPVMKERKVGALLRTLGWLLRSRLDGSYRQTPFFDATSGAPASSPKVLTFAERDQLRLATQP
jgi:hypothetical protein